MSLRNTNVLLGRQHDDVMQTLGHMHRLLHIAIERIDHMSAATDRLTASVANLTTVSQSTITLLGQLSQMIRDNAGDPTALNKLADDIDADAAALSAAVTANTPAASEPPAGGGESTGGSDTGSGGDAGSTGGQV